MDSDRALPFQKSKQNVIQFESGHWLMPINADPMHALNGFSIIQAHQHKNQSMNIAVSANQRAVLHSL
jgi:hypothetical protein